MAFSAMIAAAFPFLVISSAVVVRVNDVRYLRKVAWESFAEDGWVELPRRVASDRFGGGDAGSFRGSGVFLVDDDDRS